MTGAAEGVCRLLWPVNLDDTCAVAMGNRPNCVTRMKNAEGPEYRYSFNDCGYRGAASCLTKPPGTLRLVALGTSIGMGLFVPQEDVFSSRAAEELASLLHRPAEAQNMASLSRSIGDIPDQIPAALGMKPDALVIELCPYDLLSLSDSPAPHRSLPAATMPESGGTPQEDTRRTSWIPDARQIRLLMRESRVGYMAQHALLSDDSFLYRAYAENGDPDDVLTQPPSAACERQYARLESLFARIREALKRSDVPVFVLPIPNRIGAGMISDRIHIAGRDPEAFQRRVQSVAEANGMIALDVVSCFRGVPHAERLYYAVDSHPGPQAHILLGRALATRIAAYYESRGRASADRDTQAAK
jgi:hypothetical protein